MNIMIRIILVIVIALSTNLYGQNIIDCLQNDEISTPCRALIDQAILDRSFPITTGEKAFFVYRGIADKVQLVGDHTSWRYEENEGSFRKVAPDLFIIESVFPEDTRIDYKFVVNGKDWILDPANTKTVMGGLGPNSELTMPEFDFPEIINPRSGIPVGSLDTFLLESHIMDRTYEVIVYKPSGYIEETNKTWPSVYFQDGSDYLNLCGAKTILDNLINDGGIPPVIGVFVSPTDRDSEYAFGDRNAYASFFAYEMVTIIEDSYNVGIQPDARVVLGTSFGANISARIAHEYPEVFGKCGLHSPAFWPLNAETNRRLINDDIRNVRYAFVWGTYEKGLDQMAQQCSQTLIDKGYTVYAKSYPDGHSWGLWRRTLKEMLEFLIEDQ
jgi:enterochelin esterase-like enzyme